MAYLATDLVLSGKCRDCLQRLGQYKKESNRWNNDPEKKVAFHGCKN
jgi:hypothetical protein